MEIKFRAWINNEYMVYQGEPDLETLSSFMHHYSDAKILMLSTGLQDINGKDIFVGDIITFERPVGNWTGKTLTDTCEVIYDTECCRFALKYRSNIQKLRKHWFYKYEVIGNIYENKFA